MAHLAFTRAQAKVGKGVRTRVASAEVPPGAIGTIVPVDRLIADIVAHRAPTEPATPRPARLW